MRNVYWSVDSLCSVSYTSPILGAIKHFLSPCSLRSGGNKSFGNPLLISQAQPFSFSGWAVLLMRIMETCISVLNILGLWCKIKGASCALWNLKILPIILLDLVGRRRESLSSLSRCWIFLRVCAANITFTPRSWVDGIQWFLKDGKNILTVRWDLEYFLAVDLERLGWAVRKKRSISVALKV